VFGTWDLVFPGSKEGWFIGVHNGRNEVSGKWLNKGFPRFFLVDVGAPYKTTERWFFRENVGILLMISRRKTTSGGFQS
jgi:hypothetical protein